MSEEFEKNLNDDNPPSRPIKALLLDDSAFDRKRIRRMTERFDDVIELEEVSSIDAMADKMENEAYDLVLIDYQLTEGTGLQALDIIEQNSNNKGAARIMITGQQNTATAVSAFKQGCHDYLTKDELSETLLRRAMQSALRQRAEARHQEEILSEKFQRQIQMVILGSIKSDLIQSALLDGVKKAAQDIGLDMEKIENTESTKAILSDFMSDEPFSFDLEPVKKTSE